MAPADGVVGIDEPALSALRTRSATAETGVVVLITQRS